MKRTKRKNNAFLRGTVVSVSTVLFQLFVSSADAFQTSPLLVQLPLSTSFQSRQNDVLMKRAHSNQQDISKDDNNIAPATRPFSPELLIQGAEELLYLQQRSRDPTVNDSQQQQQQQQPPQPPQQQLLELQKANAATSRRMVLGAATISIGTAAMGCAVSVHAESNLGKLRWTATPVNKRTGVTVFDAEKDGYNVAFVTYLSRFLLCFDGDCQRWWYSRASDIPRLSRKEEIEAIRLQQFASFSASVEVGLQFYRGPEGAKQLFKSLLKRYCPDLESIRGSRLDAGLPALPESAQAQQLREIREARRQIAILFGLMEKNQPVDEISSILAAIDNGAIASVDILDGGAGYAPGYGSPYVKFPAPDAGSDYETATGRAVLVPNGKILRVDVVNRGFGYSKPPTVTISPPEAAKFGNDTSLKAAAGRAIIFNFGANKGRIDRIILTDPGAGYTDTETIRVKLSPPEMGVRDGGTVATATAVLEYKVGSINIVNGGSGYAVEKPIDVYVEPPPPTARVNMNDPMMSQLFTGDQLLPKTNIPSPKMLKKMTDVGDETSVAARIQKLASNDGQGGGGGCIGRACYDRGVVATAYARAPKDSFNTFRNEEDATERAKMEASLIAKAQKGSSDLVSASTSGAGGNAPRFPGFGVSSSVQLLSLLPEGIGLQYDKEKKRYVVRATPEVLENLPAGWFDGSSTKPRDPEFGPRGRSPIEREKELDISTYLRFMASGAVCASGVHLLLTPIDVVKTNIVSLLPLIFIFGLPGI